MAGSVPFGAAFSQWVQGLIAYVCYRNGSLFAGKYGCLVTFFDLITYFSVVALFGWFTFANFTQEEIKVVPKKKRPLARRNRLIINQLFITAFLFITVCAFADYILHHLTLSTGIADLFNRDELIVVVAETFVAGIGLLVSPILYLLALSGLGKDLGSMKLPSFRLLFFYIVFATANSFLLWGAATFSTTLFYILFVICCLPYAGIFLLLWFGNIQLATKRHGGPRFRLQFSNGFIIGILLVFSPLILLLLLLIWASLGMG